MFVQLDISSHVIQVLLINSGWCVGSQVWLTYTRDCGCCQHPWPEPERETACESVAWVLLLSPLSSSSAVASKPGAQLNRPLSVILCGPERRPFQPRRRFFPRTTIVLPSLPHHTKDARYPTMSVSVELNTPLAEALNNVVQPKLVEVGWSTGGGDDSALAEYIILMLVNKKTQEQIAAELANDLLGLGPDDTEAVDFSRWLFEQVEALNRQLNGVQEPVTAEAGQQEQQSTAQAIPSLPETSQRDGVMGEAGDMDMGEGNVYVFASLCFLPI